MKISCQSCQSKYTIADDKVSGKVVKIRCKKCGATIVVNGSEGSGAGATSYPPDPPGAEGGAWTVNVAEGDQRTMTDDEIVSAFHAGVVNDETFCWRDGMGDWLPLREIEQLSEACGATHAMQAPPPASAGRGGGGTNGGPEPMAAAPAARRVAGRQGADLFSSAAKAGGEDEVMTSAPVGTPQARPAPVHDDKMTGERNENSVLFSLSALTSKGTGPTKPTTPGVEASGLIDIRQLSAQLHSSDDKKKSRIDDIMNLAGGGAFSPSLSGPILAAPAVSEYSAPEEAAAPAAGQGRGRGVVIAAAAAGVLVIVGAIGTATMMMKGKGDTADKDKTSASEVASAGAAPSGAAASSAPAASATAPVASATAAASAPAATAEAPTPSTAKVASKGAAKEERKENEGAARPAPARENSLAAAMAGGAAAAPAAAPAAASGAEFNMGEAKARLGAAAAAAQGCKKGDGPTGSGRVVVVFAPSGAAQSATVTGPPFEGTPTGACVAARFRGVHVPAFSGSPFSVSKSFSVN